jgi:VanZ family protein
MEKKIKKISLALFCVYVIAVILLCVIKTEDLPELPKLFLGIPLDKIAHFIMFFPFIILGYVSFMPTEKGLWRRLAVLGTLLTLGCIFAFATEKVQAMTAYRSYEILDMAADSIGLLGGTAITLVYIIKTSK